MQDAKWEQHDSHHHGNGPQENGNGQQQNPDVVLDLSKLKLDAIALEMGRCKARLSVDAGLGNLLQVQAGINIEIEDIKLSAKGLEADALMTFRLDQVAEIFRRTLASLDENPELLRQILHDSAQEVQRQANA